MDHDYAVAIDTLNSDTATEAAKKKAQKYLDNIQTQYGFNEAVEYDSNGNPVALSKRIQQAGGQRFSQEDSEYMELAKDPEKNEYRLDQMVGHAAFKAGYKQMMFHETSAENIHVFDISRGDHSETDSETPYGMREAEKRGGVMADEIADIRRYASNASYAKAKVAYTAYNNDILEFSADLVIELNKEYGLRFYSYSDYHPAFLLENMQMYTDAAVKGLKGLAYTKDIDYARIFEPTGANINISTKAMDRPVRWDSLTESQKAEYSFMTPVDGMVYMPDAMQGANWAEAIALRQKSIENGTGISVIMVCTSDAQVEWAMKQEWCDVIIPYHVVFSQAIKDTFLWKNYKAWQEDKKIKGKWKEGNAKHITPIMHGNDLNTYLKALEENNLSPRFEQWLKKDPENYMKLVNETRRSYRDTQALQPIFNMEEARKVGEKLENGKGYDWFGHYLSENEDVADEFVDRYNAGERYNASVGGFTDKATADMDHDYAVAIDTLNSDTATKTAKKKAQKYLDNIKSQYGFAEAVEYDSNGNPVALSKRIAGKANINASTNHKFSIELTPMKS